MRALIVDDFADMRDLIEFVLSVHLHFQTVTIGSGNAAIALLQKDSRFDLIVSDMNMPDGDGEDLYAYYTKAGLKCPFVVMSGDDLKAHPALKSASLHWIAKPFQIDEVVARISKIMDVAQAPTDSYVPVSLGLLRKIHDVEVPLFVRINDHKYVKVTSGPSTFNDEEASKYEHRGARYMYIESKFADTFIAAYRKKVLSTGAWHEASTDEHETISLDIELLKNMSSLIGWDNRMVDLAKHSIHKTLHLVKTNPDLHWVLNQFHKIERFGFADHCTVSLLISAGLLKTMGYGDEMSLAKVTFASVLHDMNLTDEQYEHKSNLIKKILNGERASKDAKKIFEHPSRAADLCKNWDFCPPGTEMMIRDHHERSDGKGFPAGKTATNMDFMTSLFIVAEDFSDYFIASYGHPDLNKYLESRRELFNRGHFKSVFRHLENVITMQSQQAS